MALTDRENFFRKTPPDPAALLDSVSGSPIPLDSLARLPVLHAEAERNARLGGFIEHSVPAAGLLMLAGLAILLAGGGTLQSDFAWSALVLAGIAAILVNYIRGPARAPRRTKLEISAADLRAILLYTGTAWGAGAFLSLPAYPGVPLIFAFAMGPALLIFLLKDQAGFAAFMAPIVILTAAASSLLHWPAGQLLAAVILSAGTAIIILPWLHSERARLRSRQHRTA
jgi:hypothetical protein